MRVPREQRLSRVILDPVTLEPCALIIEATTVCEACGNGRLLEVYDDQGQLVRRSATGQLCWHWRANQLSTNPPQTGGVDKNSNTG